jgi:hypothetical protein
MYALAAVVALAVLVALWMAHAERREAEWIEAMLPDDGGVLRYNRLEVHPALRDQVLVNKNGTWTYEVDDDAAVMDALFPEYTGPAIASLRVDRSVMLSVDSAKYTAARAETLRVLSRYVLPPLSVRIGYTPSTIRAAPHYGNLASPGMHRSELALGMLDIFEAFVAEFPFGGWMLFLEDDVRPVNVADGTDFSVLRNVPADAELIRPIVGRDERTDLGSVTYRASYGGGLNHAFYISSSGCVKVLRYARTHKWRYVADIDLYKLARGCGGFPTGLDGWSLASSENRNDISPLLGEADKIAMYHTSHVLFDQTSLPITRAFKSPA